MANQVKWKSFEINSVLFTAGQFDDVLSAFENEWSRLNNPNCSAIFKDASIFGLYYISTKEPSLFSRISQKVELTDCSSPPGERAEWLAGHRPSVGR